MDDLRKQKIQMWLKCPSAVKFPTPVNLPEFSRKSFRSYEEMNAWKRKYLKQIAERGGIQWKFS